MIHIVYKKGGFGFLFYFFQKLIRVDLHMHCGKQSAFSMI